MPAPVSDYAFFTRLDTTGIEMKTMIPSENADQRKFRSVRLRNSREKSSIIPRVSLSRDRK